MVLGNMYFSKMKLLIARLTYIRIIKSERSAQMTNQRDFLIVNQSLFNFKNFYKLKVYKEIGCLVFIIILSKFCQTESLLTDFIIQFLKIMVECYIFLKTWLSTKKQQVFSSICLPKKILIIIQMSAQLM